MMSWSEECPVFLHRQIKFDGCHKFCARGPVKAPSRPNSSRLNPQKRKGSRIEGSAEIVKAFSPFSCAFAVFRLCSQRRHSLIFRARAFVELYYRQEGEEKQEETCFRRQIDSKGDSKYLINGRVMKWEHYNERLKAIGVLVRARNFLVFQVSCLIHDNAFLA